MRSLGLIFLLIATSQQFREAVSQSQGAHGGALQNDNCECFPGNQPCPPRYSRITTRIVNTRPADVCPIAEVLCCREGTSPILGPPVQPTLTTGCGSREKIPLLQGNLARSEADLGEYPWMVAIVDIGKGVPSYVGGGVLVSDFAVLTAAHRLENIPNIRNLIVRLGDYDLADPPEKEVRPHQAIGVSKVIVHPHANYQNLQNNVAILKLSQRARTNNNQSPTIRTACLPFPGQTFEFRSCFVSGWGQNAFGKQQSILREVDLPILESVRCQTFLRTTELGPHFNLDPSLICAGGEVGKDTCKGDGGSPLVCNEQGRWVVLGLVAGGLGCGTDIPGLYVNVPHLASWITQNI